MKIGFIGTGQITKAVVTGILNSKLKVNKIYLSKRNNKISK
jgi:Pyrroline-5-carboxylate reductase